jgi:hypothetical protein
MLSRAVDVKTALQQALFSEPFLELERERTTKVKAQEIKALVLCDELWEQAAGIVELGLPITELIDLVNSDVPSTGKVYHAAFMVEEALKALPDSALPEAFRAEVLLIYRKRWNMMCTPLHTSGYAFDPEWLHIDVYSADPEIMEGVSTMIGRLTETVTEAAAAERQFRAEEGPFGAPAAKLNARQMPAWQWWQQYGVRTPELRKVAIRVLAQVVAATASERNWSTMGFIHSDRRNRLSVEKCSDLTFCYSSLRLRDKITSESYTEEYFEWD